MIVELCHAFGESWPINHVKLGLLGKFITKHNANDKNENIFNCFS